MLLFVCLSAPAWSQVSLDAGLAFGTEVKNPGISLGGEVFVLENISVAPGAIIYFENRGRYDNRDWWEVNINGHYYFAFENELEFYALAGINVTTRVIEQGELRDPDAEVGLNLGIGMNYEWRDWIKPFASLKYIAGNGDQAVFSAGMRFVIRK